MINFQIHERKFNINEFTRLLAIGDISPFVPKEKSPNVRTLALRVLHVGKK